ncbi:uncharacterized protein LOC144023667 isoform X2 [Festucalex cinctus]
MELEVDFEFEASVALFTALAILVAAAVLLRRYKAPSVASSANVSSSSSAAGVDDDDSPSRLLAEQQQAVPEPKAVSANEPVPVQESQTCTGTASATEDNLPEAVCELAFVQEALATPDALLEPPAKLKVSELLPDPVKQTVSKHQSVLASHLSPETPAKPEPGPAQESNTQLEPVLEPLSTPETVPQLKPVPESLLAPETFTQPERVLEPLSEPVPEAVALLESALESLSEPVPETATQPESVRETVLTPVSEAVTQLKSAIETCSVLEQVSKSTVKSVPDQLADADPSEAEPEAVTCSEPVSVAQVFPEAEPTLKAASELKSIVQSESELNEVLQIAAEPVLVHLDKALSAPLPLTPEPVAVQKVEPQVETELNGEAAVEDRVTFTPGKKANKFETLMTKEEMEEEQRSASISSN